MKWWKETINYDVRLEGNPWRKSTGDIGSIGTNRPKSSQVQQAVVMMNLLEVVPQLPLKHKTINYSQITASMTQVQVQVQVLAGTMNLLDLQRPMKQEPVHFVKGIPAVQVQAWIFWIFHQKPPMQSL